MIANEVLRNSEQNYGYDARAGEYTDMVKKGVIDPTKVVRSALQNAASVATLLLTSDALVADAPKDGDKKKSGGGGGRRVRRHVLTAGVVRRVRGPADGSPRAFRVDGRCGGPGLTADGTCSKIGPGGLDAITHPAGVSVSPLIRASHRVGTHRGVDP